MSPELPADSGVPAKARAADKRELILEASIRVFARRGFYGTRVSDIANEAGIAYGLVYHYFENKEDVLHTVFAERWRVFEESIVAFSKNGQPLREQLCSIAELALGGYRTHPDWVKVLIFEFRRSSMVAHDLQVNALRDMHTAFFALLRAGQQRGELRPKVDLDLAATVFIGALELLLTNFALGTRGLTGDSAAQERQVQELAKKLVDMFLHGLAQQAGAAAR